MTHIEAMKQAIKAAYLAGFNASGEGYNGEYPFGDKNYSPVEDPAWLKDRENYVNQAIATEESSANQEPKPVFYVKDINGNFYEYTKEKGHTENCAAFTDDCSENHLSPSRFRVGDEDYTSATQEPVAWGMEGKDGFIFDVICPEEHAREEGGYTTHLYTHQQPKAEQEQKQPLTNEQITELFSKQRMVYNTNGIPFARAIEAAHGII